MSCSHQNKLLFYYGIMLILVQFCKSCIAKFLNVVRSIAVCMNIIRALHVPYRSTVNVILQTNLRMFNFQRTWILMHVNNYNVFYHGYCKYQKNAAVIIQRYTTLHHNGLWEVTHISSFDTMWRNPCKSCQLHVDFTFQMWCWPCIFRTSM